MSDSQIRVHGAEPERPELPPRRRGGIAVAIVLLGMVAGIVIGAAFANPGTPSGTTTPAAGSGTDTPTTAATPEQSEPTLAEMVPAFRSTLALLVNTGSDTHVVTWSPGEREPAVLQLGLPMGTPVPRISADSSGMLLSVVAPSPFGQAILAAGHPPDVWPLAAHVTGAVWHPTGPAQLAWVEAGPDGGFYVYEVQIGASPTKPRLLARLDQQAIPQWWSPSGLVLVSGTDILVVDPSAPAPRRIDGGALGGGESLGVFTDVEGKAQLVDGNLQTLGPVPWGLCPSPSFAPGTTTVAVVCSDTNGANLQIWQAPRVQRGVPTFRVDDVVASTPPAWSPDGRFVVAAGFATEQSDSELLFVDTQTWRVSRAPVEGRVWGIAVLGSPASP